MIRRFTAMVLLLSFCCLSVSCALAGSPEADEVTMRALLVGAERFISQPDTEPAARNNLVKLTQALGQDSRGFQSIRVSLNEAHNKTTFSQLVEDSFYGADENDISYFYITTHGLYGQGQAPMAFSMLLSDGSAEYELTAQALYEAIKLVPGLKIMVIDTCNAGAIIDRGLPDGGLDSLFHGENFRVLTSSGGSEPSFFWSTGEGSVFGGSYFADALFLGISPQGNYAADENRDGIITFHELHRFLLRNYGAARPYIYPLEDQSAFLCYDTNTSSASPSLITDLTLSQSAFSAFDPVLHFSYTLNQSASVKYQLVYREKEHWQFLNPEVIDEADDMMGRKERLLKVIPDDPAMAGYALLFLTTVNGEGATPHAQSLLTVEPAQGDPRLAATVMLPSFIPGKGEELPIMIQHDFPLRLTVKAVDEGGKTVKLLAADEATRPGYLPRGGSLIYWNGLTSQGHSVPGGFYQFIVSSDIGGRHFETTSAWVRVN